MAVVGGVGWGGGGGGFQKVSECGEGKRGAKISSACVAFFFFLHLTSLKKCEMCRPQMYSQLPLRWTRSGPALTVRLREVSTLEVDEVNDCQSMAGTNSMCDCFREVSALKRCPL